MKHLVRIFGIVLIVLLLVVPISTAQDTLEEQTILLTFIPDIQFSPLYATIANGYFAEIGLDISLEYLWEPEVVDLVAANRNAFGVVSGEQVILAVSQDRPITYVYEWFQEYPIGIVYSADADIETIEDFAGMRIGLPTRAGANYSGLTTLLESAGMEEIEVQLEEIGFNAPDVFCIGAIDASVIYLNNEPLQIRNRAQNGDCGAVSDVSVLPVSAVADLVSNGLITNQETLENDPDFVRDVLSAFDKGLRDVINNPARAYLLSAAFVEGLPQDADLLAAMTILADEQDILLESDPDMDALYESHQIMYDTLLEEFDAGTLIKFEVLLESIRLWNAEQLGYSDLESWENMQATLLALGSLEEAMDLETLFTNEFLPEDA